MPCDVVPLVPLQAAGVDRGGGGSRDKGMRLGPDGQDRPCPVGHGVCSLDLSEDLLRALVVIRPPSSDLQGYGRSTWE
jgi:hypothetical protein